jgi:hypothetical protein
MISVNAVLCDVSNPIIPTGVGDCVCFAFEINGLPEVASPTPAAAIDFKNDRLLYSDIFDSFFALMILRMVLPLRGVRL